MRKAHAMRDTQEQTNQRTAGSGLAAVGAILVGKMAGGSLTCIILTFFFDYKCTVECGYVRSMYDATSSEN